ncbi:hypothetical protein [Lacticaseibacillus daqingensis]|uniref:hypothetical protein n=1 Tax=Lacticaseibacillus daqingensis TaxID=2486014 RepID=UPI000F7758E1|nr:hypothetical protein [Lacticaseibacillus daqingensis]
MPLLALLLDALAFGLYTLQPAGGPATAIGLALQGGLALILLVMTFGYKGKRLGWFNFNTWAHNFTLRYAIIVLSLIANALLVFLYYLSFAGLNNLLFQ